MIVNTCYACNTGFYDFSKTWTMGRYNTCRCRSPGSCGFQDSDLISTLENAPPFEAALRLEVSGVEIEIGLGGLGLGMGDVEVGVGVGVGRGRSRSRSGSRNPPPTNPPVVAVAATV